MKKKTENSEKALTLTFEQFHGAVNMVVARIVPQIAQKVHDHMMNNMRDEIAMRARDVSVDEIYAFFSWLQREKARQETLLQRPRGPKSKR